MISIVVAHSHNRVIGRDGRIPWDLPIDRRRFRALTTGRTVVMGRRTFASLPERFRPLPERRNVVISGGGADAAPGAEVYPSLVGALKHHEDCVVIGGARVYADALPYARRVDATEIVQDVEGDAFFPFLNPGVWCLTRLERPPVSENGYDYWFTTYERKD